MRQGMESPFRDCWTLQYMVSDLVIFLCSHSLLSLTNGLDIAQPNGLNKLDLFILLQFMLRRLRGALIVVFQLTEIEHGYMWVHEF